MERSRIWLGSFRRQRKRQQNYRQDTPAVASSEKFGPAGKTWRLDSGTSGFLSSFSEAGEESFTWKQQLPAKPHIPRLRPAVRQYTVPEVTHPESTEQPQWFSSDVTQVDDGEKDEAQLGVGRDFGGSYGVTEEKAAVARQSGDSLRQPGCFPGPGARARMGRVSGVASDPDAVISPSSTSHSASMKPGYPMSLDQTKTVTQTESSNPVSIGSLPTSGPQRVVRKAPHVDARSTDAVGGLQGTRTKEAPSSATASLSSSFGQRGRTGSYSPANNTQDKSPSLDSSNTEDGLARSGTSGSGIGKDHPTLPREKLRTELSLVAAESEPKAPASGFLRFSGADSYQSPGLFQHAEAKKGHLQNQSQTEAKSSSCRAGQVANNSGSGPGWVAPWLRLDCKAEPGSPPSCTSSSPPTQTAAPEIPAVESQTPAAALSRMVSATKALKGDIQSRSPRQHLSPSPSSQPTLLPTSPHDWPQKTARHRFFRDSQSFRAVCISGKQSPNSQASAPKSSPDSFQKSVKLRFFQKEQPPKIVQVEPAPSTVSMVTTLGGGECTGTRFSPRGMTVSGELRANNTPVSLPGDHEASRSVVLKTWNRPEGPNGHQGEASAADIKSCGVQAQSARRIRHVVPSARTEGVGPMPLVLQHPLLIPRGSKNGRSTPDTPILEGNGTHKGGSKPWAEVRPLRDSPTSAASRLADDCTSLSLSAFGASVGDSSAKAAKTPQTPRRVSALAKERGESLERRCRKTVVSQQSAGTGFPDGIFRFDVTGETFLPAPPSLRGDDKAVDEQGRGRDTSSSQHCVQEIDFSHNSELRHILGKAKSEDTSATSCNFHNKLKDTNVFREETKTTRGQMNPEQSRKSFQQSRFPSLFKDIIEDFDNKLTTTTTNEERASRSSRGARATLGQEAVPEPSQTLTSKCSRQQHVIREHGDKRLRLKLDPSSFPTSPLRIDSAALTWDNPPTPHPGSPCTSPNSVDSLESLTIPGNRTCDLRFGETGRRSVPGRGSSVYPRKETSHVDYNRPRRNQTIGLNLETHSNNPAKRKSTHGKVTSPTTICLALSDTLPAATSEARVGNEKSGRGSKVFSTTASDDPTESTSSNGSQVIVSTAEQRRWEVTSRRKIRHWLRLGDREENDPQGKEWDVRESEAFDSSDQKDGTPNALSTILTFDNLMGPVIKKFDKKDILEKILNKNSRPLKTDWGTMSQRGSPNVKFDRSQATSIDVSGPTGDVNSSFSEAAFAASAHDSLPSLQAEPSLRKKSPSSEAAQAPGMQLPTKRQTSSNRASVQAGSPTPLKDSEKDFFHTKKDGSAMDETPNPRVSTTPSSSPSQPVLPSSREIHGGQGDSATGGPSVHGPNSPPMSRSILLPPVSTGPVGRNPGGPRHRNAKEARRRKGSSSPGNETQQSSVFNQAGKSIGGTSWTANPQTRIEHPSHAIYFSNGRADSKATQWRQGKLYDVTTTSEDGILSGSLNFGGLLASSNRKHWGERMPLPPIISEPVKTFDQRYSITTEDSLPNKSPGAGLCQNAQQPAKTSTEISERTVIKSTTSNTSDHSAPAPSGKNICDGSAQATAGSSTADNVRTEAKGFPLDRGSNDYRANVEEAVPEKNSSSPIVLELGGDIADIKWSRKLQKFLASPAGGRRSAVCVELDKEMSGEMLCRLRHELVVRVALNNYL